MSLPYSVFTLRTESVLGPDPEHPKTLIEGIARIYRGLGISALRSVTTHGLLWTIFDYVSTRIDHLQPSEDED